MLRFDTARPMIYPSAPKPPKAASNVEQQQQQQQCHRHRIQNHRSTRMSSIDSCHLISFSSYFDRIALNNQFVFVLKFKNCSFSIVLEQIIFKVIITYLVNSKMPADINLLFIFIDFYSKRSLFNLFSK